MSRDIGKAKGERELFAKLLAKALPPDARKAPARVLSELIEVGERDARYYLDGERAPGLGVLARIELVLGITPGLILRPEDPPARSSAPVPGSTGGFAADQREQRGQQGQLLRVLTAADDRLRTRVARGEVGSAEVAAIAAHQAGQMLADRIAAVIKQTFEDNEIADTKAGRQFTIAFLDRVVDEFGALGLNVSDLARYANELRREQGKP